jgi:general secretion pathway protein D
MKIKSLLIFLIAIVSTQLLAMPLIDYIKSDTQLKLEAEKPGYIHDTYLNEFTNPWDEGDPDEKIEFRFENASLSTFIEYFAERFKITFLLDEALNPLPTGAGKVEGNKITFSTNKPFSKKEAWGIFTSFLDLAGLTVIPGPSPRVFKIAPVDQKSPLSPGKNPLPLFIDTALEELPSDDTVIRYIVFIKNTGLDVIGNVIEQIKSINSPRVIGVPDMRAFILTDKSSNIKNMLAIIRELDQSSPAEILRVLKLERIDASRAVALYKDLVKTDEPSLTARLLGQRKKPSTNYFSDNVRLTPIPHMNSIVMIGTKEAVGRVYNFIQDTLDKPSDALTYRPFFPYKLKHKDAADMARILNEAVKFQIGTEAQKSGGVRDGDKFFKNVYIAPEQSSNSLIIYAEYEDYTKIVNLLKRIDVEEQQIAIKVLLLNIDLTENKDIGTQLRNKIPGVNGLLGKNVNFQTSGLAGTSSPVIENPNGTGATRLLGDLINLAQLATVGSTLLTLGSDIFGVWGLFTILEQYTKTSVVSNPFLVTTNKYPATISVGEIRRVLDSQIQNSGNTVGAYKDMAANLTIAVTPQISGADGLITLDVVVNFEQFTSPAGQNTVTSGNRTKKAVSTSVIMGNNEVLALGGLIQDTVTDVVTKVPILGDIPILGNLFKNTVKETDRSSLLVLIMPEIIPTDSDEVADKITEDKILDTKAIFYGETKQRDPFLRWFFKDQVRHGEAVIDEFVQLKDKYIDESQYARIEKPLRLKKTPFRSLIHEVGEDNNEEAPVVKESAIPLQEASSQVTRMAQARYGKIENEDNDQEKAG